MKYYMIFLFVLIITHLSAQTEYEKKMMAAENKQKAEEEEENRVREKLKVFWNQGGGQTDFDFKIINDQSKILITRNLRDWELYVIDYSAMRVLSSTRVAQGISNYAGSRDGRFLSVLSGPYLLIYDTKNMVLSQGYPEPFFKSRETIIDGNNFSFMQFDATGEYLIIAGRKRVAVFSINNKKQIYDSFDQLNEISNVAYQMDTRILNLTASGNKTSVDLSRFIPLAESIDAEDPALALNKEAESDFIANLAVLKKENFFNEHIQILTDQMYQYTFQSSKQDYLVHFDKSQRKIVSASRYKIDEVEFQESIGKVKHDKKSIFKSCSGSNQYTEASILTSKFDQSKSLFFQDLIAKTPSMIYAKNSGFKYDFSSIEPVPSPEETKVYVYRLTNKNLLAVIVFAYARNFNMLFPVDVSKAVQGNMSYGVYVTKLITFSPDGKNLLNSKQYLLPKEFEIRLGPDGSFAVVGFRRFKPLEVSAVNTQSLISYYKMPIGLSVSFFSPQLSVINYQSIDVKKDERIKDTKYFASISDPKRLLILYGSYQNGSINEIALSADIFDFASASLSKTLVNESYFKDDYHLLNLPTLHSGYIIGDKAYFLNVGYEQIVSQFMLDIETKQGDMRLNFKRIPYKYFRVDPREE